MQANSRVKWNPSTREAGESDNRVLQRGEDTASLAAVGPLTTFCFLNRHVRKHGSAKPNYAPGLTYCRLKGFEIRGESNKSKPKDPIAVEFATCSQGAGRVLADLEVVALLGCMWHTNAEPCAQTGPMPRTVRSISAGHVFHWLKRRMSYV